MVSPVRVRVSPSGEPESRLVAGFSGSRSQGFEGSDTSRGSRGVVRPSREFTIPAIMMFASGSEAVRWTCGPFLRPRVLLHVLIDRPASEGASCNSTPLAVGRPLPAWVGLSAHRSRLKPPVLAGRKGPSDMLALTAESRREAQHRRGRLRVVPMRARRGPTLGRSHSGASARGALLSARCRVEAIAANARPARKASLCSRARDVGQRLSVGEPARAAARYTGDEGERQEEIHDARRPKRSDWYRHRLALSR